MKQPTKKPSLRDLCLNSLGEYFLATNPSYNYVDYQQERIVPAIEGLEAGGYERLMIFIAAGHAKTDIGTKSFIPWYMGRNPGHNVILFCHTAPLAKDFGSDIRNRMTKNEAHAAVFPNLKIDTSNHASDFFRTNQGGAFYAFGMDGGASGRRGDLVVIEDPIRDLQDALSETVQHVLYNTYKAVIKDRLRPGGKILFIMTRWAVRDMAARILEDEGRRWKVLALKAQEEEPDGPYLWESHFGRERYAEAKQDTYIWNAKWQQNPTPLMNQSFKLEWLKFYLPEGRPTEYHEDGSIKAQAAAVEKMFRLNTYIFVDPALGKGSQHDRTCILVPGCSFGDLVCGVIARPQAGFPKLQNAANQPEK